MNAKPLAPLTEAAPSQAPLPAPAQRALTFGLLLSALRCTTQYVVFPIVLPVIGVTATIPPWITIGLAALALASLTRNVRYLWRIRHPRRQSYLVLALVITTALLTFIAVDLHSLVHA